MCIVKKLVLIILKIILVGIILVVGVIDVARARDVTAYAGWTYSTGFGGMGVASSQLDTYLHLSWQRYYPKLLKSLDQVSAV